MFGTTVSKSFARKKGRDVPLEGVDTVNISVASYRVVEVNELMMRLGGLCHVVAVPNFALFFSRPRGTANLLSSW